MDKEKTSNNVSYDATATVQACCNGGENAKKGKGHWERQMTGLRDL